MSRNSLHVPVNSRYSKPIVSHASASEAVRPRWESVTFDDQYLARLKARDQETQNHFYQYFSLPIRTFMRVRFRWEDAEDLTQQVFLAALEKIDAGALREAAKLPGYVIGISRHICRQHIRKVGQHRLAEKADVDVSQLSARETSAETNVITRQLVRAMSQIVEQLPARDREALMRELEEQPREQIAQALGVNIASVRLIVHRAWHRVRLEWRRTAPEQNVPG